MRCFPGCLGGSPGAAAVGRVLAGSWGLQVELEDLRDAWLQLAKVGQGGREPHNTPLLPCHHAGAVVGLELDPHLPQQHWRGREG